MHFIDFCPIIWPYKYNFHLYIKISLHYSIIKLIFTYYFRYYYRSIIIFFIAHFGLSTIINNRNLRLSIFIDITIIYCQFTFLCCKLLRVPSSFSSEHINLCIIHARNIHYGREKLIKTLVWIYNCITAEIFTSITNSFGFSDSMTSHILQVNKNSKKNFSALWPKVNY